VIVQGATSEIAEKVIKHYPTATFVSRDRGTAYVAAATKSGKNTGSRRISSGAKYPSDNQRCPLSRNST